MNISNRINQMSEPALYKFYPDVHQKEAEGKKFYYLNIGQPDIETPKEFMDKVKEVRQKVLSYSDPEGQEELRKEALKYYKQFNLNYDEDDILITSGGSEALLFVFLTICNPGDQILTPEPFYSVYKEIAKATSVELVGIPTYAETQFSLPEKEIIEDLITDKTRGILITNPNNPTGKVFTKKEIEAIKDLCLEKEIFFIADEVYREFIYDGSEFISPGHYLELNQNTIIVDSVSKRYSACGARIGFIISKNKDVMLAIKKLCQMRLAVSSVDQQGATELFKLDTSFFDKSIKEYEHRRNLIFEKLKDRKDIVAKKPTGAFYYMVKLPVKSAEPFIDWLINEFDDNNESVILTPANDFYLDPEKGKDEVRLAYVLNEDELNRAIDVLLKGLDQYKKEHPENIKKEFK